MIPGGLRSILLVVANSPGIEPRTFGSAELQSDHSATAASWGCFLSQVAVVRNVVMHTVWLHKKVKLTALPVVPEVRARMAETGRQTNVPTTC